jgi:hypothetical protein
MHTLPVLFIFDKIMVRVKFTLQQVTKGPEGSRGIALIILNLGARRGWVVSTTPQPLYL